MESQQYLEIGAWWHPRSGNSENETDNEIDIVTVGLDGEVCAYEVKRNKKKYSEALLEAKVRDMKQASFGQVEIKTACLSLEDM